MKLSVNSKSFSGGIICCIDEPPKKRPRRPSDRNQASREAGLFSCLRGRGAAPTALPPASSPQGKGTVRRNISGSSPIGSSKRFLSLKTGKPYCDKVFHSPISGTHHGMGPRVLPKGKHSGFDSSFVY